MFMVVKTNKKRNLMLYFFDVESIGPLIVDTLYLRRNVLCYPPTNNSTGVSYQSGWDLFQTLCTTNEQ